MTTVVALGGNALARRGEAADVETQARNARRAAATIAALALTEPVVVTHGNGPQVGLLALMDEATAGRPPTPLDVLGAETEGQIGYLLQQELGNVCGPDRVVTVVTRVVVDQDDPRLAQPSKPIGPPYPLAAVESLRRERHWAMALDGDSARRVVPSPEPRRILELAAIRLLSKSGFVVIAAGGGGIPVMAVPDDGYRGVEAVVDKDLASALLAIGLPADRLLLLTDVDAVYADFGTPMAMPLRRLTVNAARRLRLPSGSMHPKVEAACRFVLAGGRALIGSLDDVPGLLAGSSGTEIVDG